MDKISGILPTSARISSVDLADSVAIRPGMPTFGARQGVSALKPVDRVSFSSTGTNWKDKQLAANDIVTELTNNFFHNRSTDSMALESEPQVHIIALVPDVVADVAAPEPQVGSAMSPEAYAFASPYSEPQEYEESSGQQLDIYA